MRKQNWRKRAAFLAVANRDLFSRERKTRIRKGNEIRHASYGYIEIELKSGKKESYYYIDRLETDDVCLFRSPDDTIFRFKDVKSWRYMCFSDSSRKREITDNRVILENFRLRPNHRRHKKDKNNAQRIASLLTKNIKELCVSFV